MIVSGFVMSKKTGRVVSVSETQESSFWMFYLDDSLKMIKLLNVKDVKCRQEGPKIFLLNGSVYLSEVNYFREKRNCNEDTIVYPNV